MTITTASAAPADDPPHAHSNVVIKPQYDPRLTNEDLAPLSKQTWGTYNIFAFWMSDVHSVGGYLTAASLFSLGLSSLQVLFALLVGIVIVQVFCNLVARPSQATGTPYPVICRASFGVLGANIPAIIRGLIAVAWYGIQTYLASHAFLIVALKFMPELAPYADLKQHGFVGLSTLGWAAFMLLWVLQAFVFWHGMESIRKFIDWAGPAVYVVMIALAVWLVHKAGWENINFTLSFLKYEGWDAVPVMLAGIALVVSYFSGPMLNFGDFSRYGKDFGSVKRGNFWGLPVNFLGFALLVVITTSATLPVFGQLISDPVEVISRIDNTTAVVIGALTFMIATIGINIVANFVSPAFDFSNVAPQHISWRTGGMIAAVALQQPRGDPLHDRRAGRLHRPAVRHPDCGLLLRAPPADQRGRSLLDAPDGQLLVPQRLQPGSRLDDDPVRADPDGLRGVRAPAMAGQLQLVHRRGHRAGALHHAEPQATRLRPLTLTNYDAPTWTSASSTPTRPPA